MNRSIKYSPALLLLLCPIKANAQTCDQTLWKHVYHAKRLVVHNSCAVVTGVIVDATKGRNKDGARHEADGDGHFWSKSSAEKQRFNN